MRGLLDETELEGNFLLGDRRLVVTNIYPC